MFSEGNVNTYFTESWKKGKEKVKEQEFSVELTGKNNKYETVVNNINGKPKYKLVIDSATTDRKDGSDKLLLYGVYFYLTINGGKENQVNLLKTYNYYDYDCLGCDHIWVVLPDGSEENGTLAYNSKRVIKIENFYCLIEVTNCKIFPTNMRLFESVNFTVKFLNQYTFSEKTKKYPVY
jgi:hypothetical protein